MPKALHRKMPFKKKENSKLLSFYIPNPKIKSFNFTQLEYFLLEYKPHDFVSMLSFNINSFVKSKRALSNCDQFFIANPYVFGNAAYFNDDTLYFYAAEFSSIFYPSVNYYNFCKIVRLTFELSGFKQIVFIEDQNYRVNIVLQDLKTKILNIIENIPLSDMVIIEKNYEYNLNSAFKEQYAILKFLLDKKNILLFNSIDLQISEKNQKVCNKVFIDTVEGEIETFLANLLKNISQASFRFYELQRQNLKSPKDKVSNKTPQKDFCSKSTPSKLPKTSKPNNKKNNSSGSGGGNSKKPTAQFFSLNSDVESDEDFVKAKKQKIDNTNKSKRSGVNERHDDDDDERESFNFDIDSSVDGNDDDDDDDDCCGGSNTGVANIETSKSNTTTTTTNNNNNNNGGVGVNTILSNRENEIINIAHCSKTVISKKKEGTTTNNNNNNQITGFERVSIFTPQPTNTTIAQKDFCSKSFSNNSNSFYINSYTSSQNSFFNNFRNNDENFENELSKIKIDGPKISQHVLKQVYSANNLYMVINQNKINIDQNIKTNRHLKAIYNMFTFLVPALGKIPFSMTNNTIFLVYGFLNLTRYHITNVCSRVVSTFNAEKKNVLKSSYFEDVVKNSHLITHVDFLNSILSRDKDTFRKMIDSSGMFNEYFSVVKMPKRLRTISKYELFASDMLSFLIKNDITRGYLDSTTKISIEPGCLDTFFRFMLISAFSLVRMIFIISAVLKPRSESVFLELVDDVLRGNDKLFFDTVNGEPAIISGIVEQLTYDTVNYVLEYLGTLCFNYKSGQVALPHFFNFFKARLKNGKIAFYEVKTVVQLWHAVYDINQDTQATFSYGIGAQKNRFILDSENSVNHHSIVAYDIIKECGININPVNNQNNQNIQNYTPSTNQYEAENTNSTCSENKNIDNFNIVFDEHLDYVENIDWNNIDTNNMLITNAFDQNSANINCIPNNSPSHAIDNILFSNNNNNSNQNYNNNYENINNNTPATTTIPTNMYQPTHTTHNNYVNYDNYGNYINNGNFDGMFRFNNPSNTTNTTTNNNIHPPENFYNMNQF